ncbi:MAG: 16S rRNA (guanine(527)-N(7))-methyltransferase RsmG [Rhodospirillales bacterium]
MSRASGPAEGPEALARRFGLRPENLEKLRLYADLLVRWNSKVNLIGPGTAADIWGRHFHDSLQLEKFIPDAKKPLADLGSGAGFPGLALAVAGLAENVTLIESNRRKAEFLRHVSRETSTPARVLCARAETLKTGESEAPEAPEACHVITSRALAPLDRLLTLAAPFAAPDAVLVFPKGAKAEAELTDARKDWILDAELHPSETDPDGRIVVIGKFHVKHPAPRT